MDRLHSALTTWLRARRLSEDERAAGTTTSRSESGQAVVVTVLFMTALLGMAALTIDVGSWYRAQRELQAAADAATLAAVQELPQRPDAAVPMAWDYLSRNHAGGANATVTVTSGLSENDTVTVSVAQTVPGIFSKVFGIDSVVVRARAAARATVLANAEGVAPFYVHYRHPVLASGVFSQPTEIELDGECGHYGMFNPDGSRGGHSSHITADWVLRGYQGPMPLGWYFTRQGRQFHSSNVRDALDQRIGTELLIPVYDVHDETCSSHRRYRMIGFAAFYLTGYEFLGTPHDVLRGEFRRVTWQGLDALTPGSFFGVTSVALIE